MEGLTAHSPSLQESVRSRSLATAIRLGTALFFLFCVLFFYQKLHENSEKIEQKITIDQELLANALSIGDLFFVTQYLSAFVDSKIISGGGIRDRSSEGWIVRVPEQASAATTPPKGFQLLRTGVRVFDKLDVRSSNGGLWEIHYFYKIEYSLFFYALMFSVLIGILVFLYINHMLKDVAGYFSEPVLNISKDLADQKADSAAAFKSPAYDQGRSFHETDQFVNELKTLVAEINLKNIKLKEAEIHEAISRLSRQVNHDIKSPLGALKVALGSIHTNSGAATSLMTKSIDRIEKILSDLQMPDEKAGAKILNLKEVPVGEFLKNLVDEKRAEFEDHKFSVTLKDHSNGCDIEIDQTEVSRAISNIINNAVEAARGGAVEVLVACQINSSKRQCSIEISDNGPGVPEELRNKIFEYGVSTKDGVNSGTGLSQAREALKAHGGDLTLGSDESGSYRVFKIRIPTKIPWGSNGS